MELNWTKWCWLITDTRVTNGKFGIWWEIIILKNCSVDVGIMPKRLLHGVRKVDFNWIKKCRQLCLVNRIMYRRLFERGLAVLYICHRDFARLATAIGLLFIPLTDLLHCETNEKCKRAYNGFFWVFNINQPPNLSLFVVFIAWVYLPRSAQTYKPHQRS